MAVIALAADKGSPGVTTAAIALGAVWPRPVLVAECDQAGGDLVYRLPGEDNGMLNPTRGLLSLAATARRGLLPGQVWEHTQRLAGGLDVLVGLTNAEQAQGMTWLWEPLGRAFSRLPSPDQQSGADVLVDCGRLGPSSPLHDLLDHVDIVLLLARPTLEQVAHLRERVGALAAQLGGAGRPALCVAVIAEHREFRRSLAEVQRIVAGAELPATVLGGLAFDPKGAELLRGEWGGRLDRSLLIRSAREIAGELLNRIVQPSADDPAPGAEADAPATPSDAPPADAQAAESAAAPPHGHQASPELPGAVLRPPQQAPAPQAPPQEGGRPRPAAPQQGPSHQTGPQQAAPPQGGPQHGGPPPQAPSHHTGPQQAGPPQGGPQHGDPAPQGAPQHGGPPPPAPAPHTGAPQGAPQAAPPEGGRPQHAPTSTPPPYPVQPPHYPAPQQGTEQPHVPGAYDLTYAPPAWPQPAAPPPHQSPHAPPAPAPHPSPEDSQPGMSAPVHPAPQQPGPPQDQSSAPPSAAAAPAGPPPTPPAYPAPVPYPAPQGAPYPVPSAHDPEMSADNAPPVVAAGLPEASGPTQAPAATDERAGAEQGVGQGGR